MKSFKSWGELQHETPRLFSIAIFLASVANFGSFSNAVLSAGERNYSNTLAATTDYPRNSPGYTNTWLVGQPANRHPIPNPHIEKVTIPAFQSTGDL
jgi:hypothetical protein